MNGILDRALSFIETPFRHQGRQPGVGLDCLGVVVCSIGGRAHELDEKDYAELPDGERLQAALEEHFERLPTIAQAEDAPAGTVLAFWTGRTPSSLPRHVAIRSDVGMVHVLAGGRVADVPISKAWVRRFLGGYRWPEQQAHR